jgi:hypothetical protein
MWKMRVQAVPAGISGGMGGLDVCVLVMVDMY